MKLHFDVRTTRSFSPTLYVWVYLKAPSSRATTKGRQGTKANAAWFFMF